MLLSQMCIRDSNSHDWDVRIEESWLRTHPGLEKRETWGTHRYLILLPKIKGGSWQETRGTRRKVLQNWGSERCTSVYLPRPGSQNGDPGL